MKKLLTIVLTSMLLLALAACGSDDKIVAVQNGTTGQASAESILGENSKNIKKFENNNLAIMELLSGGADAVIADNTVLDEYVENNPDKNLTVISDSEAFDSEFYGLMFPKGSQLKAEFDVALNALLENGKYTEIYENWFGAEPDLDALKEAQVEGDTTAGDATGSEKKTLRVVTDAAYAPFEYLDGDQLVGFDIDLMNALAEEAGYEVEINTVGWDPLFIEIQDEIADIAISAITINDDRKETYDFSVPYFLSTNKILVPADSDIKSASDLTE